MSKASQKAKQLKIKKSGKKYQKKLVKLEKTLAKPDIEQNRKFLDKLEKDSHNRWWSIKE